MISSRLFIYYIVEIFCRYVEYSNWNPGEPEGGTGQNCLIIHKPSMWKWHDAGCNSKYGYICELTL